MNGPTPPCNGCSERKIGCHGSCEKYSEYRSAMDDILNKQLEERKYVDYITERAVRILSRCGRNARQL